MRALRYRRGINGHRIGFCPFGPAILHFQAIHGGFEFDLDQDVVIIDFLALKRIISGAPYRISVGATATGCEVSDATVLMPFVVMDMAGKHDDSGIHCFLLPFQVSSKHW